MFIYFVFERYLFIKIFNIFLIILYKKSFVFFFEGVINKELFIIFIKSLLFCGGINVFFICL